MDKLIFNLPYPPSLNTLYPTCWKTKRRFLSKKGKDFVSSVKYIVGWRANPIKGEVKIVKHVYPPDARRRDGDNIHKAINDSLVKCGLLEDDDNKHIVDDRIIWHKEKRGCVVVSVELIHEKAIT